MPLSWTGLYTADELSDDWWRPGKQSDAIGILQPAKQCREIQSSLYLSAMMTSFTILISNWSRDFWLKCCDLTSAKQKTYKPLRGRLFRDLPNWCVVFCVAGWLSDSQLQHLCCDTQACLFTWSGSFNNIASVDLHTLICNNNLNAKQTNKRLNVLKRYDNTTSTPAHW